ncbi:hypothetical protein ABPG77_007004 [Micractinium sp. CCAP 211/92]
MTTGHLLAIAPLSLPARQVLWIAYGFLAGFVLSSQRWRKPGVSRLAAALPLLLLNLLAPLLFDGDTETLANFSCAIATAFISNMKLLGWIMGRGSLVSPTLSPAQFAAVYTLPITPAAEPEEEVEESNGGAEAEQPEAREGAELSQAKPQLVRRRVPSHLAESYSTAHLLVRFLLKAAALVWTGVTLHTITLPRLPQLVLEVFSQHMILSISADGLGAAASALLGISVSRHFENPYGSTSVADFWNKRWNLVVSNVLRACIYDPIMEGRLVTRPNASIPRFSRTRRMAAVLTVFVASGLVHEVLFWYQSGTHTPHLLWFWHFVAWGCIIVAENVGKKALRKAGLRVPTLLSIALFQVLMHIMLGAFWFPPLHRMAVMEKGAASIVQGWQLLKRAAWAATATAAAA